MTKAYWQVPVCRESIQKTAISTPFGVFVFKRMPFGLKNAGSTFQSLIGSVLVVVPYCWSYMDDLLLYSRTNEEHEEAVREVLTRLRAARLVFNPNKSKLFRSTIDFLGHNISVSGITPIAQNTNKLSSFSTSADKTALKRFLGLLNYYRRFIPGLASLVKPPLT